MTCVSHLLKVSRSTNFPKEASSSLSVRACFMRENEAGTAESLAGFSLVLLCYGLEWNKAGNYGNVICSGWNFPELCQLPLEQLSISFKISIAKIVFLELQSILTSNEKYLDNVTVIFFAGQECWYVFCYSGFFQP